MLLIEPFLVLADGLVSDSPSLAVKAKVLL